MSSIEYIAYDGSSGAYTKTNDDGTFEMTGIPVGMDLFLYAQTEDYKYLLTESLKPIQEQTVLAKPLLMQPSQWIDILFTDKKGDPIPNMSLGIQPVMWQKSAFRANRIVETDEGGRLKIDGIAPGLKYWVYDARISAQDLTSINYYFHENIVLLPEGERKVEVQLWGDLDGGDSI